MKNTLVAVLILFLVITSCQKENDQTRFLELTEITQERDSLIILYLNDLEAWSPDSLKALTPKIKSIHIKFALNPDTDDETKQIFISDVKTTLQNLKAIQFPSNIKSVSFDIGEQIFVKQSQADSVRGDYDKIAEINIQKAWMELSPQLKKLFPQARFYAYNWGW